MRVPVKRYCILPWLALCSRACDDSGRCSAALQSNFSSAALFQNNFQGGKRIQNHEGNVVPDLLDHAGLMGVTSVDSVHDEDVSSNLGWRPERRSIRILAVFGWTMVGGLVILGAMFLRHKRDDWTGSDVDTDSVVPTPAGPTPREPLTSPRKDTPRSQAQQSQTPRGTPPTSQSTALTQSEKYGSGVSGVSGITGITGIFNLKMPKMFTVFGREVLADDHAADYLLVLPLRGRSSSSVHVTAGHMQVIHWDEPVDGLDLARRVFQDAYFSRIMPFEELSQRFQQEMNLEQYILTMRNLMLELLTGPHCGLKIKVMPSIDNDELLLKISLPHGSKHNSTIQQYAANIGHKMPLSDVAYERIGRQVTKDILGTEMRAVAEFLPEQAQFFQPFSRIDRLVLIKARLDKFIDLEVLSRQYVIVGHFPLHNYTEVTAMCEGWANPWQWYRLPTDDAHHSVRNYFGEEVAWMFVWQSYFTRALLLPASFGAVVWYCRFVLPVMGQHKLQIVYAIFMGLWCTWFNAYYDRKENRLRHSWGMNDFTPLQSLNRYDYKPELDQSYRVQWAPVMGDALGFLSVCLSVSGMTLIQQFRTKMVHEGHHWLWIRMSGVLISFQILALDRCWRYASKFVVSLENHRSERKWLESWVRKLFPVRLFNNLYPFLYIGFIKQFTREGCPKTQDGCLQELEADLITYFILRIMAEFAIDLMYLGLVRAQMLAEMKKNDARGRTYTYVEVQSKAWSYDTMMLMDDWTEQLLTFAFVACFNVILPAISLIALLANLLETRLVAYRNACFLRRPLPAGAKGIGAWRQMLLLIEVIAVIVNLGFAVFVLTPLSKKEDLQKCLWFLLAEHVALFAKFALKSKFPSVPRDIENIAEQQHQDVKRTFVDLEQHRVEADVLVERLPDVGPRAMGGRDHSFPGSDTIPE